MNGHDPDAHRLSPERRTHRRAPLPAVPKPAPSGIAPKPPNDRHAAITDNLNKWHNYKRWTEKIRSTWDDAGKLDE